MHFFLSITFVLFEQLPVQFIYSNFLHGDSNRIFFHLQAPTSILHSVFSSSFTSGSNILYVFPTPVRQNAAIAPIVLGKPLESVQGTLNYRRRPSSIVSLIFDCQKEIFDFRFIPSQSSVGASGVRPYFLAGPSIRV